MSAFAARRLIAAACMAALGGCQTVGDVYDRWFGSSRPAQKPAELVSFQQTATPRILWQGNVGNAGNSVFYPAVSGNVVYAAGASGQIIGFDAASGSQVMRVEVGQRITRFKPDTAVN